MTIRVAQIGTGNVGVHALRALISNPEYELTGVWVSSETKAGKDAGELAGLERFDRHHRDHRSGRGAGHETAVRGVHRNGRQPAARRARRLPAHPGRRGQRRRQQRSLPAVPVAGASQKTCSQPIEDAAREGNSSLFVNGIDPGFANDLLPLALAGTCQNIQQIRCMEIVDYATYDSATVMFDVMGFGKPIDEIPMLLQPGVLSLAWGSVVRQLAAGLGLELDAVERDVRARVPHPRTSISPPGISRRAAPPRCGSRCSAWSTAIPSSSWSTSPACATTCARTGRNPLRPVAPTASRSPANRRTASTSA